MKWFFERYKRHRGVILMLAAIIGTPSALVVTNVLEVADKVHDESRATLGKSPVPAPAPEPVTDTPEADKTGG